MKNILLTSFSGTSSEILVKKADYKSLILPNDKILDAQILFTEMDLQSYSYIFSFGQKPNIKDKIYLETTARNGNGSITTDFAYGELVGIFKSQHIPVQISDNAGTSFCNALYWNALKYIRNKRLETKMIFLHIPFLKNIKEPDAFFERILTVIGCYC